MKTPDNNTPDFRNLFESVPGLYLVLSRDLKIVAVSNAYLKATMTKREEIIGRGIFEVFPDNPDDSTASGVGNLSASLNRVLQTKVADTMAVQKYDIPKPESAGGGFEEKYWSPLNTPIFGTNNELQYIIHQVEDVTEFIHLKQQDSEKHKLTEELKLKAGRMETEIFRRAQEIQEANKKLREAEKVKSEFFANVSHELRTPLSLILAPLESVLAGAYGAATPEQTKPLQIIHNNAIRLLQMVNGLLDFAKFEAGKMLVERESTDIESLMKTVINDFESMMRGKKIHLSHNLQFGQSKYVKIDRYLLERILFNLLSNAAKFTPNDGKVSLSASLIKDRLLISVEDTGIGIPESGMKDLFQKFSQAEGSSTRRHEGTGLGLAMVKEFTELLGGSVTVKSEVGKGSAFRIDCFAPVTDIDPEKNATVEKRNLIPEYTLQELGDDTSSQVTSEGLMKVLVCEDNEELLSYIVSLLHKLCMIKTAKDGEQALEIVQSWKPDLILSDVMMPKRDGISLCKEIKSNTETSKTTVVLLTALTHREAMLKGWEAKADEYLFKPFHPQELITRIRSLLSTISERKKSDFLLDQKSKQLAATNADLEAFSYSVSHDLRAPLRSIMGYSKALEEDCGDKLSENDKRTLSVILHNADKMNKLIDSLLNFAKVSREELQRSEIDIKQLVSSIINEINSTTRHKANFTLRTLFPAQADQALLSQVWVNLVSNAIKYSTKKENPMVEIGSIKNNNEIIYHVKDNGAGFSMEYADKLFGVFQRLHAVTDFEGTGVGLAIVKRIVTRHGGRVWAEGKENDGATFYFSLPIFNEQTSNASLNDFMSAN